MGPTASGKTAMALQLARTFSCEIINVDSALVYRDMDIGTAKPTKAERAECPHHLIDIISPQDAYSAARFCNEAIELIYAIHARHRLPLLVGGTMLYFKALREGLSDLPQADEKLRQQIEAEAARYGWPALHARLAQVDATAAAGLNPNDAQRIQRALEIVTLSGQTLATNYALLQIDPRLAAIKFLPVALHPTSRSELHAKIAMRFDLMLQHGLVDEVKELYKRYQLTVDMPSMRCVGYRQVLEHLNGSTDYATMRSKGIAATRQLAKRQITWLRQFTEKWPDLINIDSYADDAYQRLETTIKNFLMQNEINITSHP